jgi:biotin operon repressor
MSLQTKVLNVLRTGKNFSAVAIAKQLRTTEGSVSARISELRSEGHAIYSNKTDEGRTAYRLGNPSRRMVAAAFASQGSSVFS